MARRSLLLQASFNYERMQAGGWLYQLIPGLRKIHRNPQDLANSMKMHMEFINVHPFDVTFLSGPVLAMEQNKEKISTIRAVKVALMGPLGGIGDALFWLTLLPICAGIGASLALEGSLFGPIVFLLLFNLFHFGLRFGLAHYGYQAGTSALALLKTHTRRISHAASIVGMTVIGALVARMCTCPRRWSCMPARPAWRCNRRVGQADAQPVAAVLHAAHFLPDEARFLAG